MKWNPSRSLLFGLLLLQLAWSALGSAQEATENRFERAIQQFEAKDKESPPPANPIVFVGSSSIRRWDLSKSFADLNVINRGFGGSRIPDSVYFCERIVTKYNPPLIVFYAGDNDLGGGGTPEKALADYRAFVEKAHAQSPKSRIIFVSIKPSIRRWSIIDKIRDTNARIKQYVSTDPLQTYLDIEPAMLGEDGKPRPELYVADGLHPSEQGYAAWAELLRPLLVSQK